MKNERKEFVNIRYNKFTYQGNDHIRIHRAVLLIPRNSYVLDIGCGDGTISTLIRDLRDCKVVGIDLSDNALKIAKNQGIECVRCDVEERLPFKDLTFDCVFAGEIIEHIYDTDSFIKEVYRVLKQRGVFIITTPNLAGLGSRISLLLGKKPWMIENRLKPQFAGHIRYFTAEELKNLLEDNGFKIEKISGDCVKIFPKVCTKILADLRPTFALHLIVKGRKA